MGLFQRFMNKIFVNDTYIKSGNSLEIKNGQVIIDGVDCTPDLKNITVRVEGSIEKVSIGAAKEFTVNGNVETLTSTAADVKITGNTGNINTTSGDVEVAGSSQGIVTVSGDVKTDSNTGGIKTLSGDINIKRQTGDISM